MYTNLKSSSNKRNKESVASYNIVYRIGQRTSVVVAPYIKLVVNKKDDVSSTIRCTAHTRLLYEKNCKNTRIKLTNCERKRKKAGTNPFAFGMTNLY